MSSKSHEEILTTVLIAEGVTVALGEIEKVFSSARGSSKEVD